MHFCADSEHTVCHESKCLDEVIDMNRVRLMEIIQQNELDFTNLPI